MVTEDPFATPEDLNPPKRYPSGWDTGFFRVQGPEPSEHLFINKAGNAIKSMPYDWREEGWEPIYVYLGK
jgi:hypothetical protein